MLDVAPSQRPIGARSTVKAQDRLQPALLDRLTDDDPTNPNEAAEMRIISRTLMREAVLRDLGWLFNTTFLDADDVYADYPEVRRSVLNYGLPALSGRTASSMDPVALEAKVKTAILNYEPRIVAETLQVEAVVLGKQMDHHNQISFRISGQLWSQPVPLEMLLHTDIDLETGRVGIKDLTR
jgi:type VI secretion system protein ImpF